MSDMLDEIVPEAGAFYVMDRGYIDFERLYVFTLSAAFFVVRTKEECSCCNGAIHIRSRSKHWRALRSHRGL